MMMRLLPILTHLFYSIYFYLESYFNQFATLYQVGKVLLC